jgi:hypothetical protein
MKFQFNRFYVFYGCAVACVWRSEILMFMQEKYLSYRLFARFCDGASWRCPTDINIVSSHVYVTVSSRWILKMSVLPYDTFMRRWTREVSCYCYCYCYCYWYCYWTSILRFLGNYIEIYHGQRHLNSSFSSFAFIFIFYVKYNVIILEKIVKTFL